MNWGTKIIIVFSLFVAGILVMVIKASKQEVDLVVPDYYEQELKYQGRIDELERTSRLSEKVDCRILNDKIEIVFPKEMQEKEVSANAWLYCIADKSKDLKKDFVVKDGKISLPVSMYNKGLHEIKLQWVCDNISYYFEQKIFIQ